VGAVCGGGRVRAARRWTRLAAVGAVLTAGLGMAAPASAYKLGGARWPGATPRIRFYDATPASYRYSVDQAVLAWNTSGVRVRFVKVRSRRRAAVVIRKGPAIGPGSGVASVGAQPGAFVELNKGGLDRWEYVGVVAHELGHVVGLEHEARGCVAMSPAVYENCRPSFPRNLWQWRCRVLQRDDLNGARRRYGGRIRLRPKMFCDKAPPAPAPPTMSVTAVTSASPLDTARITVTIPRRAVAVQILRKPKTCPTGLFDFEAFPVGTIKGPVGGRRSIIDRQPFQPLEPGPYCYRAFATDTWGRTGGSRSAAFTYAGPPPPPAPVILALTPNPRPRPTDGSPPVLIDVLVTVPTGADFVDVYRHLGTCPASSQAPGTLYVGRAGSGAATRHVPDEVLPDDGHWCYAAFSGGFGNARQSAPATRQVDYVGPRSGTPTGATAQRVDATTVHIAWTWPAGAVIGEVGKFAPGCAGATVAAIRLNQFSSADPVFSPAVDDVDAVGAACYGLVTEDQFGYPSAVVTLSVG